jgi:hypothetical protein
MKLSGYPTLQAIESAALPRRNDRISARAQADLLAIPFAER